MKLNLIILICFCFFQSLNAQKVLPDYLNRVDTMTNNKFNYYEKGKDRGQEIKKITKTNNKAICPDDGIFNGKNNKNSFLFTNPTLNRIIAKRIAYYLSGNEDLSLFKNYATANSSDGTITVGYNKGRYKDDDEAQKLESVTNYALKGKLAELISEGKFQRNIGFQLNHTIMGNGKIRYCLSDARNLIPYRNIIRVSLEQEHQKEIDEFDKSNANVRLKILPEDLKAFDDDLKKRREKLLEELFEKYKEKFVEEEEKAAEYNDIRTNWLTFSGYLPLNTASQKVANSTLSKTEDKFFFPVEFGLTWTSFMERNRVKKLNYLFSFGVKFILNNKFTYLEKYSKFEDNILKTLELEKVEVEKEKLYKGVFNNFSAFNIKPRLLLNNAHANGFKKKISYDLFADIDLGKYKIINPGIGLLFSLPPADPDKPVNVGLTLTFQDVTNEFIPDVKIFNKLKFGLTMSLPFNSIIY